VALRHEQGLAEFAKMRVVALLVGVSVSVCGVAPGNGVEAPAPFSLRCARCFASRAEWDVTGAPPHGREFRQHTAARSDALLGDHPDRTSKVPGQGSYRVSGACAGVDGSMWEYLGAAGEEVDSGNSSEFEAYLDDAKQAFNRSDITSSSTNRIILPGSSNLKFTGKSDGAAWTHNFYCSKGFCKEVTAWL